MTIQECFQAAARIEVLLRDLYAQLARCFHADPRVADCFRDLAADVGQRALRIRLLAIRRGGAARTVDSLERISKDVVAVVAELSAMARDVGRDPDGWSGIRVLKRVIDAERRCGSIHGEVLGSSADPMVHGFFYALARQDAHHERLLGRALEARTRGKATSLRPRSAYAPSWPGGGSFEVAWRAREGRQGAAPWQST